MRQRSERAGTGTGRRSSSDRSRRSRSIESEPVSQRYEALRRVLQEPTFVANVNGDLEILSAPMKEKEGSLPHLIHGRHIRDTNLPEPVKLALMEGIRRALRTDDPVRIKCNVTRQSQPTRFEIQLTCLNPSEVLGIIRDVTTSTQATGKRETMRTRQEPRGSKVSARIIPTRTLEFLERERRVFRHQISQELASAVMPIVARMKDRARPSQRREAEFMEAQLNAILATDIDPFWERYAALTPREMELCELLKGGLSSKQVSQQLNVSLATVHKHREQIRRKLGFQHKRVNLSSYLRLHTLPVRS